MQEKENLMKEEIGKKVSTKNKKVSASKGITLIALVVTIVVLLILAGVSIVVLFGDNGMIKTAQESTLQTKLAEIEERANVAYADLNTNKYANGNPTKTVTMQEIKEALEKIDAEKYQIRTENPKGTTIKGIELTQTNIRLKTGDTATIKATLDVETNSSTHYYAKVEEKYYEMSIQNNHINLDKTNGKTEEELGSTGEGQTKEFTAVSSNNAVATITTTQTDSEATIKITPGTTIGEEATITISYEGVPSVTCKVTIIDEQMAQWEYLERVAKDIATRTDITINEDTPSVSGTTELNEPYNISVGATYKVKYNNEETLRNVRVLGFKHDDLVDQTVYRDKSNPEDKRTWEKAGISFEFVDWLTTSTKKMNTGDSNANGWAATQMRKDLNGYTTDAPEQAGAIGGEAANLSNKNQIKKVKKAYMPDRKEANLSTTPAEDYLWLLSCGEIWNDGDTNNAGVNARGYARNSEGSQYKYYKNKSGLKYNVGNDEIKKPNSASAGHWWLRSPNYNYDTDFCYVYSNGNCGNGNASNGSYVAPGFSI